MRSMKQMTKEKLKARRSRTAFEEVEEDLRLCLHLQQQESVRDTVPDQQLDFKQLLARYKGSVFPGGTLQLHQRQLAFSPHHDPEKENRGSCFTATLPLIHLNLGKIAVSTRIRYNCYYVYR